MGFTLNSNSLAGLQGVYDGGTPAQKATFQSSVSGSGIAGIAPGRIVGRWDASSLASLADGASVQRLPDLSGCGAHLIQSTAAKRPTKRTVAGKACLLFDGVDDAMNCPTFGLVYPVPSGYPQPISVFISYAGTPSTASFASLVSGITTSYSARLLTSADRVVFPYAGTSGPGCGADIRDGVWRTASMSLDTAAVVACQDGYLSGYATTAAAGTDGLANLYIGGLSSGNYFAGYIGEVIVIAGRMTLQEIDAVNYYLTKKWSAAATAGSAAGVGAFEQTASPNGQAVRIWTPTTVEDTAVIVCHKHTGSEQYAPPSAEYCVVGSLQASGYVVGASNMAGDNWGNAAGQAAIIDLWGMLKARHPSLTKLVLLAYSMGGIGAMNIVMANAIPELRGVYGIDAVSSLANMYANATYTASIRTAYGIAADGSDYAAKTAGFDPMLASVPASALTKRFVFVSSSADTAVSQSANSLSMIPRLAGAAEVTSITHASSHLAPVAMRPQSVVEFVRRCAA